MKKAQGKRFDSPKQAPSKAFCMQLPPIVSDFVDTFVDHAVGGYVLGPTRNPAPKFFSSPAMGDVWNRSWHTAGEFVKTRLNAVPRLVAIGDLHGDFKKTRDALTFARVIDDKDNWIGEKTTVVQVGDLFDRGGKEIKILYLLEKLKREAHRAGGAVHVLHGNHETETISGTFHYAFEEGLTEFVSWRKWYLIGVALKKKCKGLPRPFDYFKNLPEPQPSKVSIPSSAYAGIMARCAAMRPGGPLSARFLARNPTVLVVGGTVFVHGGIRQEEAANENGLETINKKVSDWVLGKMGWRGPEEYLKGNSALVWMRSYSVENIEQVRCDMLQEALAAIPGAKRMVVGHTVQRKRGINAACENRVWRVDVGMSKGLGNCPAEVLEIVDDRKISVLSQSGSKLVQNYDGTPGERNPPTRRIPTDPIDSEDDSGDDAEGSGDPHRRSSKERPKRKNTTPTNRQDADEDHTPDDDDDQGAEESHAPPDKDEGSKRPRLWKRIKRPSS